MIIWWLSSAAYINVPVDDGLLSTVKALDSSPYNDAYGDSAFYRNIYYQNVEDLQDFLTINGLNYVAPDVFIRNKPINGMYKKNKKGQFYIRQPIIAKSNIDPSLGAV